MFEHSNDTRTYDVAIIGAGPVGLFAITACGMMNMKSVCIENMPLVGGQCAALYPEKRMYGIPGIINETGDEFVSRLLDQANEFGPKFLLGNELRDVIKTDDNLFVLRTSNADVLARSVIIASGKGIFTPNKPPLDNIAFFDDKSVFYSIKDKNMLSGKVVCIAGGGDSAVDWCLELIDVAKDIFLIHRRNKFRCSPHKEELLFSLTKSHKIHLKTPYQLHAIYGNIETGAMEGLDIIDSSDNIERIQADVLLPFFGLANQGANFNIPDITLTKQDRIAVDSSNMTSSVEGIFAIGDACEYDDKLFVIMAGFHEAIRAANSLGKYLYPTKAGSIGDIIVKK